MSTPESDLDDTEDMFDDFLEARGHEIGTQEWDEEYNKKQCPECGGIHDVDAAKCSSCGWQPARQR